MASIDAGMSVAEVEELSYALKETADRLGQAAAALGKLVGSSPWQGPVSVRFKQQWWPGQRARLSQLRADLQSFSQIAFRNAAEQRQASDDGPGFIRRLPAPFAGGLENQQPQDAETRIVSFDEFFNRQERLGQDQFEILRVSDDPPRYIVNLPGIEFGTHAVWDRDHLRDLHGAADARLTGNDAYAARVELEMQRAGVPAGAEVMLVGHSAGAIAAMNMSRDRSFNQPGNASADGAYHVQVTHVVAAGAGVRDWMDDPPKGTNVLMLINRNDAVATAIQDGEPSRLLGAAVGPGGAVGRVLGEVGTARLIGIRNDVFDITDPRSASHGDGRLVMEFSSNEDLSGHHYNNYERGIATADAPAEAWMDDAARQYFRGGGGMQVVRVSLPDTIGYGAQP